MTFVFSRQQGDGNKPIFDGNQFKRIIMHHPYTSPLNIYVLWHPSFAGGNRYFSQLYADLCRAVQEPLSRNIGIPVFKRSAPAEGSAVPLPIPYQEADHNAIIVLVDEEMFGDDNWQKYVLTLMEAPGDKRFYPVALSKFAYQFLPSLAEIQYIRLELTSGKDEEETFAQRYQVLYPRLLHECSRSLLDMHPSHEEETAGPPIRLFISHAKLDGESIALHFRDYIRSQTKLASFFDANDIPDSYLFSKEIAAAFSKNAVIVVFQTDAYATREWCRQEIIFAKRFKTPIVVVNAITNFENRSFPYIGNVPVIRWKVDFSLIAQKALFQVLYQLYSASLLKKIINFYFDDHTNVEYIANSPELFNYVDIVKLKKKIGGGKLYVVYPDPPLGPEEIRLLNDIDEEVQFITPIFLPTQLKTNGSK